MTVPKTPCPVGGLVPWMNGRWPIASRKEHPLFGWLYVIHEKRNDLGLVIWANVSQEDVVRQMEAAALFRVGALLELGPMMNRRIVQRKWNFQKGAFTYLLEGSRPGREFPMEEEDLLVRMKDAQEKTA